MERDDGVSVGMGRVDKQAKGTMCLLKRTFWVVDQGERLIEAGHCRDAGLHTDHSF